MHLSSILKQITTLQTTGNLDCHITSITHDLRNVQSGTLFVAIKGFKTDGHRFINNAVAQGASAIIVEHDTHTETDIAIIKVADARKAMALASVHFFNYPDKLLNMIGVTGTNGKTSVTHFIHSIFQEQRMNTGVVGTMGTTINNVHYDSNRTTPESPDLQRLLKQMVSESVTTCIMEVSSHALDLERVTGIHFNTAIFTNLSPDHLELHGSMEAYFQAKAKLFELTSEFKIINADDPYGQRLIEQADKDELVTYGIDQNAHIYPTDITYQMDHTIYTANTPIGSIRVTIHLPGKIYVYNSLAAIACAFTNGISLKTMRDGLKHVTGIRGRFETIYEHNDYRVIIDFAHTEDALKHTLETVRPYVKGNLILVFGVYADDSIHGRKKRTNMGKTAASYADFSVVTLDNPREHNQDMIMSETCEAVEHAGGSFTDIKDRKAAIRYAINISQPQDTVVLAGKGHETTQIIGEEELAFNESDIVTEAIKAKQSNQLTY